MTNKANKSRSANCRLKLPTANNASLRCTLEICLDLLFARPLPGWQVGQFAKRTLSRIEILRSVFIRFVAASTDRISPTAVETLDLPSVDGQVLGFEVVIFAS